MSSTVLLLTVLVLLLFFLMFYRAQYDGRVAAAGHSTCSHSLTWLVHQHEIAAARKAATEAEWNSLTVYDEAEAEGLLDAVESEGYGDRVVVYDRDGSYSVYWR